MALAKPTTCELLADLRAFRGGFAELEAAVDLQHSDHGSWRRCVPSGELGEQGVQLLMPMAAGGTSAAGPMSLILGAVDDQVVPYDAESGYEQTPGEKLLVGLNNAGHLAFSDLCAGQRPRRVGGHFARDGDLDTDGG